jgi:hypothetical protein
MVLSEGLKSELTNYIVRKFQELQDFTDDPKEISEYIVLLISNGRNAEDILSELSDLVTSEGLKSVIESAFGALQIHEKEVQQQQLEALQKQLHEQQEKLQQESTPPTTEDSQMDTTDANSSNPFAGRSIPTKPASLASRIGNNNGVSKRSNNVANSTRNSAFKNPAAFENALNLSNDTFKVKKKGRCHKFPHCPHGKDCIYAHPTKPCFQFPNCPNAPGTCNFLHPGEDDELMAELAKTRQEFIAQKQEYSNQRKESQFNKFIQQNAGITLCKFGTLCSNPQCPFGHPTPSNEDAKVIKYEWCPENLKCTNTSCDKAHSSLSKIKPVQAPQPQQQEKSLEACKFGQHCTNRYCKYRHARTPVLCRDGEACERIDCFFSHPINQDCRFGEGCKNQHCLFKHPNGKAASAPTTTGSLTWTKTNERQFAVPEDQILEQAPPQQE